MNSKTHFPYDLAQRLIGLDPMLPSSFNTRSFPPYNLIQRSGDEYVIEMALSGYSKDDIEITEEDSTLTVSTKFLNSVSDDIKPSNHTTESSDDEIYPRYIHNGIAKRAFRSGFKLMQGFVAKTAKMEDGLLQISIVRPENQRKPNLISID